MRSSKVTAIRSVHLGVPDRAVAGAFYGTTWGLREIASPGGTSLFRGAGGEHHVLRLEERPEPQLLGVTFATDDAAAVDALHQKNSGMGIEIVEGPRTLPADLGGGYGFTLRTPDGLALTISAEVDRHSPNYSDTSTSTPDKLAHVVINSADVAGQFAFFRDALGFRLSDSNGRMDFIRCNADHHSVALAKAKGLSMNHMAFELPDIDSLMRASGRVKLDGFNLDWGVGRHGAGNNVFSYFVDPVGFVAEFTTEVEQINEANHVPRDADYWATATLRPCRWGMAMTPSDRIKKAMAGNFQLDLGSSVAEGTCDDVIAARING